MTNPSGPDGEVLSPGPLGNVSQFETHFDSTANRHRRIVSGASVRIGNSQSHAPWKKNDRPKEDMSPEIVAHQPRQGSNTPLTDQGQERLWIKRQSMK